MTSSSGRALLKKSMLHAHSSELARRMRTQESRVRRSGAGPPARGASNGWSISHATVTRPAASPDRPATWPVTSNDGQGDPLIRGWRCALVQAPNGVRGSKREGRTTFNSMLKLISSFERLELLRVKKSYSVRSPLYTPKLTARCGSYIPTVPISDLLPYPDLAPRAWARER